jgi:hypothetical protein
MLKFIHRLCGLDTSCNFFCQKFLFLERLQKIRGLCFNRLHIVNCVLDFPQPQRRQILNQVFSVTTEKGNRTFIFKELKKRRRKTSVDVLYFCYELKRFPIVDAGSLFLAAVEENEKLDQLLVLTVKTVLTF